MDNPPEEMLGLTSCSLTSFQATTDEPAADVDAIVMPSVPDTATELSSTTSKHPDAETSIATTSTRCFATVSPDTCSKAPAVKLQPHRMHQLKEAVMVELVSCVV
jgi:hypothetical protein